MSGFEIQKHDELKTCIVCEETVYDYPHLKCHQCSRVIENLEYFASTKIGREILKEALKKYENIS